MINKRRNYYYFEQENFISSNKVNNEYYLSWVYADGTKYNIPRRIKNILLIKM